MGRLNPMLDWTNAADRDVNRLIFSGLIRFDSHGLPQPDLAESWGTSVDGTVYNFYLRPNARWHDGTPVTSDDVIYTIELIKSSGSLFPKDIKDLWSHIEVKRLNENEFQFKLPEPFAPFLDYATFGILPKHLLEKYVEDGKLREDASAELKSIRQRVQQAVDVGYIGLQTGLDQLVGQAEHARLGFGGVLQGAVAPAPLFKRRLDPGVLVHLLAHEGYDVAALERLVDQEAGLLGVSGITADMKTLLALRAREPAGAGAVELFCHQLRKNVGALAAVLGGIDTLVFTGGIGEHAAPVRWEACSGLEHLGIRLDRERNTRHDPVISIEGSACTVRVVPTDEDLMIARHTRTVLETVQEER